jgi:HAMP domain-containing protein
MFYLAPGPAEDADWIGRAVSFRTRLILFFALIVLVPVTVVALGLARIADESRTASTDAALTTSAQTALSLFGDEQQAAARGASAAGRDPELAVALRGRHRGAAERAAARLLRDEKLTGLAVLRPAGAPLAQVGDRAAPGAVEVAVHGAGGPIGRVRAATLRAQEYVNRVSELTGSEAALLRGDRVLASSAPIDAAGIPPGDGEAELAGGESRVLTDTPAGRRSGVRIAVFRPTEAAGFEAPRPLLLAAAIAFLVLGLLLVIVLVRALQGQVRGMLSAAHRIGGGDFSQRLPVQGNDELAGLAREFNTMSERLGAQMNELRDQRLELDLAGRRIGEAFAAGDRQSLIEIAAETAVSTCGGDAARVILTGLVAGEVVAGNVAAPGLDDAMRAAEDRALGRGVWSESQVGGAFAVAQPLPKAGGTRGRHAAITIARVARPFDASEREMLRYLADKLAVALEKIELHELVSERAVTTT